MVFGNLKSRQVNCYCTYKCFEVCMRRAIHLTTFFVRLLQTAVGMWWLARSLHLCYNYAVAGVMASAGMEDKMSVDSLEVVVNLAAADEEDETVTAF